MAWQTPPTFTASVLSAAQLNIISDDLEFLYGLAGTVNIPFVNVTADPRALQPVKFQIRHRAAYLNLYVAWVIDAGWVDHLDVSVKIGGVELVTGGAGPDPWVPGGASPKYFAFDVSSLTVGDWYEIEINVDAHDASHAVPGATGSTSFVIQRLFESDSSYA